MNDNASPPLRSLPLTAILLFDGFDDLDAVAPLEILTAAGFPVRQLRPAAHPPTVHSAHGLVLDVRNGLGEGDRPGLGEGDRNGLGEGDRPRLGEGDRNGLGEGDRPGLIVVPGGGWLDGSPSGVRAQCAGKLPSVLGELHAAGTVLASVCTGVMLLAAAGVLTGRPAVTNRMALDDLAAAGADVRREARVVDDGSVITAGGPAAGLDLALHLVQRFAGADAGVAAARRLEHRPVGPVLVDVGVA
jgi:putative intracellular protease/amidase